MVVAASVAAAAAVAGPLVEIYISIVAIDDRDRVVHWRLPSK